MLKNSCQRPHAWRKRAKRICSRTCFTWYQPSSKTLVYGSDLPSVAEFEGSMIQYDPIWSNDLGEFSAVFFQCISKHSKLYIYIYIRSQSQVLPVPVTRNRRCGWVSGSQSLSNCKSFLHLCGSHLLNHLNQLNNSTRKKVLQNEFGKSAEKHRQFYLPPFRDRDSRKGNWSWTSGHTSIQVKRGDVSQDVMDMSPLRYRFQKQTMKINNVNI